MNDNQTLVNGVLLAIGAIIGKILSSIKFGENWGKKIDADHDCKVEVRKLELTVSKLHTTIKLVVQFIQNPENIEATKGSLEQQLKEIEPIIEEIHNKK